MTFRVILHFCFLSLMYQLWPNPLHSPSLTISQFVHCTVCALPLPQSSLSHLSQEHGDGIPPGLPSFIIIPSLTYPSCCQRVAYVLKWKSHCITSLFKLFNRSHGPQKKHLVSLVWHIKTSPVFSSTRLLLSTLNPPTHSLWGCHAGTCPVLRLKLSSPSCTTMLSSLSPCLSCKHLLIPRLSQMLNLWNYSWTHQVTRQEIY